MSSPSDKTSITYKTAEKLNEILPVQLTARDVQQNPEFVKLLGSLAQQINNKGVSFQVQKDHQQAEEEIRHAKHTWLLQNVLYRELKELLLDYELESQDVVLSSDDKQHSGLTKLNQNYHAEMLKEGPQSLQVEDSHPYFMLMKSRSCKGKGDHGTMNTDDTQFHTVLQECLTMAEIGDYLDCSPDPGSKVTLLGLSKEYLHHQNPYKKHLPYLQQKLIPEIEERLRKKCENLVNFYEPQNNSGNTQLTFAKSSQLPAMVEADKHRLEEEKKFLKKERQNKDKQFALYYQTLLDSLELLEQLISKYRLQNQAEHDTITTEWLVARCDGLCLKIRLMELQILCDTYTTETVKALNKVRDHIDGATNTSKKEYTHIAEALKSYEAVGMGFDDLVEEYRTLKTELDNKQWALSELQKDK